MKLEFRVPENGWACLLDDVIEEASKIGLNIKLPYKYFYDEPFDEHVFVQENTDWSEVTEDK